MYILNGIEFDIEYMSLINLIKFLIKGKGRV